MLRIMKNNWNRLMEEKLYVIISILLTVCAVAAAIVLTNKVETKGNIALIQNHSEASLQSPFYNITYLKKEPPMSELVQNRYDAVVIINKNGTFAIKTIKSDEFKATLQKILSNSYNAADITDGSRKIGTNIIGYIMMFLLMQGVLYARLFAEDKEKHMIERVSMSPIPFGTYLIGHGLFMWLLTFIPSFAVVGIARLFGISVGFSMFQYIMLIGIISFLAVTFALCLNSFFCVSDTANMLGSAIIVLTSILAGSFYSFTKSDSIFNKILHILPQKDFINFTNALEKGKLTNALNLQMGYVILLSIVMFVIAVVKTKTDYVYKK